MSWQAFADYWKNRRDYAPLTMEAIPEIRSVCLSNLTNVIDDGSSIRAHCPLHVSDTGDSRTLRVNLDPSNSLGIGFFKCYSCKRSGHWNVLADEIGVDGISADPNPVIKNLLMPIRDERDYWTPRGLQPWGDQSWHRYNKNNGTTTVISPYAFNVLQAQIWNRIEDKDCPLGPVQETRAWLPVFDRGLPVAHVAALLSKPYQGSKKYKNSAGHWSLRYLAYFEQVADTFAGSAYVVLVEGSADALRLIDHNVPALPLLGVGTWTDLKSMQVASKFKHAVVCLDGDNAGQPAQASLHRSLSKVMQASAVHMPTGEDPASLPQAQFQQFLAFLARYK